MRVDLVPQQLRHHARKRQRHDRDAARKVVLRVQHLGGEPRAEREIDPADRPRREHGERGEREGAADLRWDVRDLQRQRRTRPLADRLRQQQRADERDGEEDPEHDEREHLRRRAVLDERRRDDRADAHAGGADGAVDQPDAPWVGRRVQVDQRGAGGAERDAGRDALEGAGDEQPGDRLGEREDDGRGDQSCERGDDHRPAADAVGDRPGGQQRAEDADAVDGVDERQRDRGELPVLLVDPVERRRRRGRREREADDGRDDRERGSAGEPPRGCGDLGCRGVGRHGCLLGKFQNFRTKVVP